MTLQPGIEPVCLYVARKVPHSMLPQVETESNSMIRQGKTLKRELLIKYICLKNCVDI